LTKQIGFLDIIGELLSYAPNITSEPTRHTFLYNLARIIEKDAGRSINLFSDLVGMWSGKIRRWLRGWNTISIEALCQISTELKVSPIDILCEAEESSSLDSRKTPLQNKPTEKSITPWSAVEYQLQDALQAEPPPSLEAVARRLGYYPAKLKSHFPLLCKQICSRYNTYKESLHPSPLFIQITLKTALKEQPPSSLQNVFRRLGCRDTGYYYYSNYADLCTAIACRYKKYRNKAFDKKVVQEQLKVVLMEEPAPSFSSVAKRFGHTREFLRKKYPEMAKAIVARYMQHLRRHRREHAKKLRQMIRQAIKEIAASGMYISGARVRERLREQRFTVGRDSRFKPALREVKAEMGI
jgi:transcriptional regulator with XRE-family HTH domain